MTGGTGPGATVRGADVIAQKLKAAGCTHAFGIPGGEVLTMMDALTRAGISFHLTKHENFAGFLAEGVWHATGAPGILLATIGPGVANAVNVIANAEQDRVPLVVITGCLDGADADTYTHQLFDHQAVLTPVTKASFRVNAGSIDQVLDKAITVLTTGQPGPVHLDLPIKVADAPAAPATPIPAPAAPAVPAESDSLKAARDAIAAAHRPIAIAGVDAVNDHAAEATARFVRALGAPLITTYKAKGLLDETDSLALGGAGLSPLADRHLLPLLEQADCIILIGYDPIEMRVGWRDPWPADATVIDITPAVRVHGMHKAAVTLHGSVRATLAALQPAASTGNTWPGGEPATARAALKAAFGPEADGFGPATVFHTLRQVVPANTVITADSGAHRILLSQLWTCRDARQMLQSSALCTMGCAVALAAGHKCARPDLPAMAFVGDAGLEMTLGDLATVRDVLGDHSLPIVVPIDESLALIELKQRGMQYANVGVDFPGTDFPAVARALGGHGVWIDDTDSLTREAAAAFERPGFTLLCPRIGRRAYDGKF